MKNSVCKAEKLFNALSKLFTYVGGDWNPGVLLMATLLGGVKIKTLL